MRQAAQQLVPWALMILMLASTEVGMSALRLWRQPRQCLYTAWVTKSMKPNGILAESHGTQIILWLYAVTDCNCMPYACASFELCKVQELKSFVFSFGLLDHPPNEHQSPRHAVPTWNMFRKLPSCCCRDHKWESSSPRMHNDPDGTSNRRIAWSMSDRI